MPGHFYTQSHTFTGRNKINKMSSEAEKPPNPSEHHRAGPKSLAFKLFQEEIVGSLNLVRNLVV
jgi:hypothetical protein